MARFFVTQAALISILMLAGCGSTMEPSTRHDAISASAVKLYTKAPSDYQMIDIVSYALPAGMTWDQNTDATEGFDALKAAAAAKGANGLLFDSVPIAGTEHYTLVNYHGKLYTVDMVMHPRRVMAKAIYVIKQ